MRENMPRTEFTGSLKGKEKFLPKVQDFFKFGPQFLDFRADTVLLSGLNFLVITCFRTVFVVAYYSICIATKRECGLFIAFN